MPTRLEFVESCVLGVAAAPRRGDPPLCPLEPLRIALFASCIYLHPFALCPCWLAWTMDKMSVRACSVRVDHEAATAVKSGSFEAQVQPAVQHPSTELAESASWSCEVGFSVVGLLPVEQEVPGSSPGVGSACQIGTYGDPRVCRSPLDTSSSSGTPVKLARDS